MTLDKNPEKIHTMFNLISEKYDFINDLMSFGTQKFIKSCCIKNLEIKSGDSVLDLCCGTGDLAGMIKNRGANVTGIDFSEKMLDIAKDRFSDICWLQGDVTNLPFPDESFDYVVMGFGLRNIRNAEKAIEETYRVLKPNGKFMHIDFGEKNFLSSIYDKVTPLLVKFFTENSFAYSYLIQSKREFLSPDELIKDFESKGFKFQKRKDYLFSVISCQIMKK